MITPEQCSIEDLKKRAEAEGLKWKDFGPDPLGKKYRNWYFKNRRGVEIIHVFHASNPNLFFYKEKPVIENPLKGEGPFKAIYLHENQWVGVCPVSLVEAEIVNVNAKIRWLDGEKLYVEKTTPNRLVIYQPWLYDKLKEIHKQRSKLYSEWHELTKDTVDVLKAEEKENVNT